MTSDLCTDGRPGRPRATGGVTPVYTSVALIQIICDQRPLHRWASGTPTSRLCNAPKFSSTYFLCGQLSLTFNLQNFYIEFRRGLLHPHMNPSQGNKWTAPVSLDEWKNKSASTKMDILAQLVAYHLAHDNAPPITLAEDGKTLIFPSVEEDANAVSRKHDSDRIIVFSLFPSSNEPLVQVSSYY
ncbi:hypothetical protein JVT61DRAFT_9131 [Boletus reticuloceps]|uniref:Uncharacterized protein n=1 Tax=Boletus reticuloceps TaxID=495285 RepID=A0A8I3A5E8_9AGAM|nr:hypothetical protein JVT61DRAFT_9131 [Boletus reticuloceps]